MAQGSLIKKGKAKNVSISEVSHMCSLTQNDSDETDVHTKCGTEHRSLVVKTWMLKMLGLNTTGLERGTCDYPSTGDVWARNAF